LYGAGDGSTTFNLPNLQDEFVRGSSDTLAVGTKQSDLFKSHNHSSKGYCITPVAGGQTGAYQTFGNQIATYISPEGGSETRPRNVAMLYCINATAEPSSGTGGGTTDILPVLMSGSIASDGTVTSGTGFTANRSGGQTYITFDKDIDESYSVNVSNVQFGEEYIRELTVGSKDANGFRVYAYYDGAGQPLSSFDFTVTGTETIAVGGTGGSYTPEPMVWEDKEADRATGGLYTNTNDVPLDVIVCLLHPSPTSQSIIRIDGVIFGYTGMNAGASGTSFPTTTSFTVPSGSTYQISDITGANSTIQTWFEAKVPVAIGTGGGSYTPEPMVWEDKLAEREPNINYTNDTGRLLDVSVISKGAVGFSCQLKVNDAVISFFTYDTAFHQKTVTAIVPIGATYKFETGGGTPEITTWQEAEMPLAVATGGKTVAFRGELLANQAVVVNTMTKVNIDTSSIDTDSALVDGKFQPSIAGYYQVNGAAGAYCVPPSENSVAVLFKNGDKYSSGSQTSMAGLNSARSVVSDVIYLNGTTDYLELHCQVSSTGTCGIDSNAANTYLSAVLVSGGSGDSIWTEEDGKAVYDGAVKMQDNTILTTSSSAQLSLRKGSGGEEFIINNDASGNVGISAPSNLTFNSNGNVNFSNLPETASVPNMHYSAGGYLYKSTAAFYSTEEVDEKLATKDKIIEALEARLTKLEKRIK